jgi:hypothetical protein
MNFRTVCLVGAIACGGAGAVSAQSTLYSNPYLYGAGGDCSFSTDCAAANGRGDDYAAQEFTLTRAAVITGASFTELDLGTTPTDVNWGFLQADGAGGLPGTIISAGEDTVGTVTPLAGDGGYSVNQLFFSVGPQALAPGVYYFAAQAVSPVLDTYLGGGLASGGGAETHDGGLTWAPGYEGYPSVAVALYGSYVPEPAAWAVMLLGFAGVGCVLRRRRGVPAA